MVVNRWDAEILEFAECELGDSNNTMEGMRAVNAEIAVLLHPSRAADVPQGVRELLNSLLLRFSDEFDGVILAHLKPKILGRTAKILSALSPYFHVKLTTQLLVFSPTPGMKIEGKVNKIEKDYIGVLVLGLFNSTIGVVDIRQDLNYETANDGRRAWVSDSSDHTIGLGSLIRFTVKSLQETERIIDICGALVEEDTGCVEYLDCPPSKSKKKLEDSQQRPLDSERKKRKKSKEKKKRHVDVQDIQNHSNTPELKDLSPSYKQEPLVLTKDKKWKEDQGQAPLDGNHKTKKRKKKALLQNI